MLRARVIDNSEFINTGKIRVRIEKFSTISSMRDLGDYPSCVLDGMKYVKYNGETVLTNEDTDVSIMSPIGGGFDFGIFYLPQVNSLGYVEEIGDGVTSSFDYVWVGGCVDKDSKGINIPSSTLTTNNGVEPTGTVNVENINGSLIIKLKSTVLEDVTDPVKSQKTMKWQERKTENLVILNKEGIDVYHNTLDDSNEIKKTTNISLNEEGISINYFDTDYTGNVGLNNNGKFTINSKKGEDEERSITSTPEGTEILFKKGGKGTVVTQTESGIGLSSGDNNVLVNESQVNIVGDTINVSAKGKVNLGTEGRRVLLCPADTSSIEVGNVTLTASDKIYG